MQEEINLLEEKINLLVNKITNMKSEAQIVVPDLYEAKEEIKMLKTKIAEATVKIENLLAQIP